MQKIPILTYIRQILVRYCHFGVSTVNYSARSGYGFHTGPLFCFYFLVYLKSDDFHAVHRNTQGHRAHKGHIKTCLLRFCSNSQKEYSPYTILWKPPFCNSPCHSLKHPHTNMILSSFGIPKVVKSATKIKKNFNTQK